MRVGVTDQGENSVTVATTKVTIDNTAPVVEFVAPSADSTIKGTATVTVRLDDANLQAYNLRVDSAGLQYLHQASNGEVSFELDPTSLSDGQHTLLATATDKAGNKTVTTIKVTVDNTVPVTPEPEVVPPFKVTLKVIVIKVVSILLSLLRW